MELSAVGERVFAAESIIKRRIRRVGVHRSMSLFCLERTYSTNDASLTKYCLSFPGDRVEWNTL